MKFGKGQPAPRVEDKRFVTGAGRYVDDIKLPNMAYLALVRAPYAHARIKAIDASAAQGIDGVLLVLTHDDLAAAGIGSLPCAALIKNQDGSAIPQTDYPALAGDAVRFVGQPVAAVVATSREAARDGAEAVDVDYAELPAVGTIEAAIADGAPQIWSHIAANRLFDWAVGDRAATQAAFAKADQVVRLRIVNNRLAPSAMENRAAIGEYDAASGRYTLYAQTQGVAGMRDIMAGAILKTAPEKVHVITPDVGGGFGTKAFPYPEYVCVLAAAKALGRPVKWTGERSESFLGDAHGRDMISNAALALDKDGRFLALEVESWANMGAYLSLAGPFIQTQAGGRMVGGPYRIPAIFNRVHGVMTNTAPVDAYRGAGRPEATYLTERLVDAAARQLGLDQAEIRRRNFVPANAMPYTTATGLIYDCGDFAAPLAQALTAADWRGFGARKAKAQARGKLRGIGLG
ncbi:MAG: xanthine dehydrogenase family protein molybdopterin-binding subunit, partial [Alphaproteobacteria bacterium]